MGFAIAFLMMLLGAGAGPLAAQAPDLPRERSVWPTMPTPGTLGSAAALGGSPATVPGSPGPGSSPAIPILGSTLLPGLGQALERRWLPAALFALAEGAGWWIHLAAAGDADRFRVAYRDLAWNVARGGPTPRVDGPFEYYERMIHWTRSGAYDADPVSPGLQPERAGDAFNGRQWRLAAEIFLGGDVAAPPTADGYAQALAWYEDRAYGEAFLWDWTGAEADQRRFAGLIDDTDDASRRASIALGAVVANHVLSGVEAFIAHRLGRRAVELDMAPPSRREGRGATFRVRVLH